MPANALVQYEIHGAFPATPPVASRNAYRLAPEAAWQVEVKRLDRELEPRRSGWTFDRFAQDHAALAAQVRTAPTAMIVRAELDDPRNLAYLRHAIGLATWLLDHGGLAVHDVQTLRWYTPDEWRDEVFTEDFRPSAHVVLLLSFIEGTTWLHTRGMRKLGRPDLSIRDIPDDRRDDATALAHRLIAEHARGARFGTPRGSLDDPDYNNVHVELDLDGSDRS